MTTFSEFFDKIAPVTTPNPSEVILADKLPQETLTLQEEPIQGVIEGVEVEHNEKKEHINNNFLVPETYKEGMEYAKLKGLSNALLDKDIMQDNTKKNSELIGKELELEKEKIELRKLEIEREKLKLKTLEKREESEKFREVYGSKLDEQEYVYRSLKPILETFWLYVPMNVYIMWTFAILMFVPFVIKSLIALVIGNPIKGIIKLFRKENVIVYEERLKPKKVE